ncbi:hypothetical protein Peur_021006 [Populus x canadensis]
MQNHGTPRYNLVLPLLPWVSYVFHHFNASRICLRRCIYMHVSKLDRYRNLISFSEPTKKTSQLVAMRLCCETQPPR